MSTQRPLHLKIEDAAGLETAADYYHDAVFSPEDAIYDPERSAFVLMLWREKEGRRVPTRIPFWKRRVDHWARCKLTFKYVRRADIRLYDPGVWPTLNLLRYNMSESKVEFLISGPMDVTLHIWRLEAELEDTGEVSSSPDSS